MYIHNLTLQCIKRKQLDKINWFFMPYKLEIKFLQQTSQLLEVFLDTRPIRNENDPKFKVISEALTFFTEWAKQEHVNFKDTFITRECYVDLMSILTGFPVLVSTKLKNLPLSYIVAARTNTDVVENFFSSHRAINGSNNNPTALQYAKGINTILLTRKLVSTKGNAGGKVAVGGAKPFTFYKNS